MTKQREKRLDVVRMIFAKLLPIGFIATEIENYLGQTGKGSLKDIQYLDTNNLSDDYDVLYGYRLAIAKTYFNDTFTVYYNLQNNQFVLIKNKNPLIGEDKNIPIFVWIPSLDYAQDDCCKYDYDLVADDVDD